MNGQQGSLVEKFRPLNTLRIVLSAFLVWLAWSQTAPIIFFYANIIHFAFSVTWMALIETEVLIEKNHRWSGYIPATLDLTVTTMALLLTGGLGSPLMAGYFTLTAIGTTIQDRMYALYVAISSFLHYVVASALVLGGWLPTVNILRPDVGAGNWFEFGIFAFLVGIGLASVHSVCWNFVKRNEVLLHKSQKLLETVASQEGELRIRNSIIEKDLDLARNIHVRLLPETLPSIPGLEFASLYVPLDKVGGDLYEIRQDGRYVELMVADVSGHGVSSAFLATIFRISMERLDRRNPGSCLAAVNEVLVSRSFRGFFLTALLGIFDREENTFRFASAGHPGPVLVRDGNLTELQAGGKPIGIIPGLEYPETTVTLLPGDRLFLFTDGIVEYRSTEGDLFGEERFFNLLRQNPQQSISDIPAVLMSALRSFGQDHSAEDDITMVAMEIGGPTQ
ncbi:MAG: serine/threonine-protein phosphatase [Leptospirales bacterium]|nr:serine/threonine-protein phosphatase [Leptospirales bacterium]